MKKGQIAACVIAVIIIILALGAWYVGAHPTLAAQFGFRQAPQGQPNMATSTRRFNDTANRGGFVTGSIEILNGNGFTVTLADGTTKDVTVTATTTIQDYASASSTPTTITEDQLSVGEQVSVIGVPQSDGSVVATRVRTGAVPAFGAGGRGGYGRGPAAGTSTNTAGQ